VSEFFPHGFAPLGPADGAVKTAVFSGNSMRMYGISDADLASLAQDRIAHAKRERQRAGGERSNLAWGYVLRDGS